MRLSLRDSVGVAGPLGVVGGDTALRLVGVAVVGQLAVQASPSWLTNNSPSLYTTGVNNVKPVFDGSGPFRPDHDATKGKNEIHKMITDPHITKKRVITLYDNKYKKTINQYRYFK
jgi:hypothetical protein